MQDHLYLGKETINILHFLLRDCYKRKTTSKSTDVVWVWSGMLSHAQTYVNLSEVALVGQES